MGTKTENGSAPENAELMSDELSMNGLMIFVVANFQKWQPKCADFRSHFLHNFWKCTVTFGESLQ